jgi:uncharacterized protein (TIGR01319 family)
VTRVLCLDFGSTFTKAALVDAEDGELIARAEHPTTSGTDVLDGYHAVRRSIGDERVDDVRACSSAGGGLRLAVVGYERSITAEAGRRVGLSAGARVVHVAAGPLTTSDLAALKQARPDVVLLVGGTDGGNADVLCHNARRLGTARIAVPVVLAGNRDAAAAAEAELTGRRRRVVVAANVLPRRCVLDAEPARGAIRSVFLDHVIGGKGLSRGSDFARMVRAPTPDAVLAGVGVLADGGPGTPGVGDVIVVDVGGATTDVYSALRPEGEDATLAKDVVATLWHARTVEGDLGMRWNATGVVAAARAERLDVEPGLAEYAERVQADPGHVPAPGGADRAAAGAGTPTDGDARLAELAVTVALRRHGRPASPSAAPRPLRDVALVVGSGGVLRHHDDQVRQQILRPALADHGGGWRVPSRARVAVDDQYLLFAAGLLAADFRAAAARLVAGSLHDIGGRTS